MEKYGDNLSFIVMLKSFKHKGLKRFFQQGRASGFRPEYADKLRLVLGRLEAATCLKDIANLPGLHVLKGDRAGTYSVSISRNWRLLFRFDQQDITDVDFVDYH